MQLVSSVRTCRLRGGGEGTSRPRSLQGPLALPHFQPFKRTLEIYIISFNTYKNHLISYFKHDQHTEYLVYFLNDISTPVVSP